MGDFETKKGYAGGFGSGTELALLRTEVLLEDWQEAIEQNVVLGSMIPVTDLKAESYTYQIVTADVDEYGKEYPYDYIWGAQIPRVNWGGITTKSGIALPQAFGHLFTPQELNEEGVMRGKRKMLSYMTDWIEKQSFYGIVGETAGKARTWADGGEFDTFLGDAMNGGYCTSSGSENIITVGFNDGYEWDTSGADLPDDIGKLISLFINQKKATGVDDTVITINPYNLVMILDTLTYHAMWAYFRDHDIKVNPAADMSSFQVPNLFNITFIVADRALGHGTVDIGGTSTGYGLAIMFDKSQVPFRGFQYFMPVHGFQRGGMVGTWDFMTNQGWKDSHKGDYEFNMVTSVNTVTWYPKKLMLVGGMRSAEKIS